MSDKLTFSYFPLKARGFPTLLALEVGDVNYEAHVVQFAEWGAMKASGVCPFSYLPLLTLQDGTTINEANAVLMTVGKIAGLLGDSPKDFGVSTMLACKAAEVFTELTKSHSTMSSIKTWSEDKTEKAKEFLVQYDTYLAQFDALCKDGKFTTTGTTVGEIHLFSLLFHSESVKFGTMPAGLAAFYARMLAIPAVAKCCNNETKFGKLGDYLVPLP